MSSDLEEIEVQARIISAMIEQRHNIDITQINLPILER